MDSKIDRLFVHDLMAIELSYFVCFTVNVFFDERDPDRGWTIMEPDRGNDPA